MNHNGGRRRSAQGKGREEEGSQRNESRIFLPWMVTWNLGDAPSWVFPALALSEGGNCTGTEKEGSGASVLIQPPYRFKEEGGNRTPGKKKSKLIQEKTLPRKDRRGEVRKACEDAYAIPKKVYIHFYYHQARRQESVGKRFITGLPSFSTVFLCVAYTPPMYKILCAYLGTKIRKYKSGND